MELRGERVLLRPFEERDLARVLAFAREPEVERWWPRVDEAYLRGHLGGDAFAIEHDGELVGYAEVWEELDPE